MAQITNPLQKPFKSTGDTAFNVGWLAALSLTEAIQFLFIVCLIFSFFPPSSHGLEHELLLMHVKELRPEREIFFFRVFVLTGFAWQAGLIVAFRKHLSGPLVASWVVPRLGMSIYFLVVQAYLVMMWWVYQLAWARTGLCVVAILAVVATCVWPWLEQLQQTVRRMVFPRLGDAFFISVIVGIMYVPDVAKVLSTMFSIDHFFHFDSFVMSPAWASLKGEVLNVDVTSTYSLVLPVIMSRLAVLCGGFDYQHMMALLIAGSIVYFLMCYGFLRIWLGSVWLAGFGVLLAIKLLLFHAAADPVIWRFPSETPARYFLDVAAFLAMLMHIRYGSLRYLWLTSICVGVALSYMVDTGVYLTCSYWVYLFLSLRVVGFKKASFFATLVPVVALAILGCFYGTTLLKPLFWENTFGFTRAFLGGYGLLPIYNNLADKNIWPFIIAMSFPVVYVLTVLVVSGLLALGQIRRENVMVVVICIYGMCLYHYFLGRSAATNYCVAAVPFVLTLCYWIKIWVTRLTPARAVWVKGTLLTLVILFLGMNEFFVSYPHVLNVSEKTWAAEKAAYAKESVFPEDVALIKRWTKPQDKVALVSSFATKILMDADRAPQFYYFPLIVSRPMEDLSFYGGTYVLTKTILKQVMDEWVTKSPPIAFVEAKYLSGQIPLPYYQSYEVLAVLSMYLRQNYIVIDHGKYLLALKHK